MTIGIVCSSWLKYLQDLTYSFAQPSYFLNEKSGSERQMFGYNGDQYEPLAVLLHFLIQLIRVVK